MTLYNNNTMQLLHQPNDGLLIASPCSSVSLMWPFTKEIIILVKRHLTIATCCMEPLNFLNVTTHSLLTCVMLTSII